MARIASSDKDPKGTNVQAQEKLCSALAEVSLNRGASRVLPKLKSVSPRKKTNSASDQESHAKEVVSASRRQRVFRAEHVDSLTLPSLNGVSAKSFRQGERSPVRATPRRAAKEAVFYQVVALSPSLDGKDGEETEWSRLEESEEDEDEESEVLDVQPRQLWPSPAKRKGLVGKSRDVNVVDLTSPRKEEEPGMKEPVLLSSRVRGTSYSDDDNLAVLRL